MLFYLDTDFSEHFSDLVIVQFVPFLVTMICLILFLVLSALILTSIRKYKKIQSDTDYMLTISANSLMAVSVLLTMGTIGFIGFIGATYSLTGLGLFIGTLIMFYVTTYYLIPNLEETLKRRYKSKQIFKTKKTKRVD